MARSNDLSLRPGANTREVHDVLDDLDRLDVKMGMQIDEVFRFRIYAVVSASHRGLELIRRTGTLREAFLSDTDKAIRMAKQNNQLKVLCLTELGQIEYLHEAVKRALAQLPALEKTGKERPRFEDFRSRWNAFEAILAIAIKHIKDFIDAVHDIEEIDDT